MTKPRRKKRQNLSELSPRELQEKRKRLAAEIARRNQSRQKIDFKKLLFKEQLEFVQSDEKFIAACCSRRAGKTFALVAKLLDSAYKNPGAKVLYLHRSQDAGSNTIIPILREIDRRFDLGLKFVGNRAVVRLPNGSELLYRGAGNISEVEKFRGPKFVACVVDEAQAMPKKMLRYIIDEAIGPTLMDYGDRGWLALAGTPNAACAGGFYDAVHNIGDENGWDVYGWNIRDNPHIPDVYGELRKLKIKRGWTDQTPAYQREYGGKWVKDAEGLVFREFSEDKNASLHHWSPTLYNAEDWSFVLGVDIGYNDPSAFAVFAYSAQAKQAVCVRSWKEPKLRPSQVSKIVSTLDSEYNFERIVFDSGGAGKGYMEEFNYKYGDRGDAAQKSQKNVFVEFFNDSLATGQLKFVYGSNRDLIAEMAMLQWDQDELAKGKLVYDKQYDDHLCDAALYAFRECLHTLDSPTSPSSLSYTREGAAEAVRRMKEAIIGRAKQKWWQKY